MDAEADGEPVGGVERDAGGGPALDGAKRETGSSCEFAVVVAGDGGEWESDCDVACHGVVSSVGGRWVRRVREGVWPLAR
jgi:hypothetical protein